MPDGSKPAWWRPSRAMVAAGQTEPSYARAHVDQQAQGSGPILVARGLSSGDGEYDDARAYGRAWGASCVQPWVSWVESFGPVVQVHLAAKYPLSRRQHLGLVDDLQQLYRDASGERPRAVAAFQHNDRGGEHSHALLCGSEKLRGVSRKLAFQLVREVGSHMIGADQPRGVSNELRALILPVTSRGEKRSAELTLYVVRYVLREDREQALEVLT